MFGTQLFKGGVDFTRSTARKLYKSKLNEHKQIKSLIGFSLGVLLTVGVYFVVISTFDQSQKTHQMIVVSVGTWLCIGGAISAQVRCFMLLLIPTFFGRIGRSILLALAFSYVLKGPVVNISNNMEEIVRVFSCSGNIAINLTASRLELMFHPVHDVMRALKVAAYDMQGQFSSFTDAFYPLIITTLFIQTIQFTSDQEMISVPMNVCSTINDKVAKYFTKFGLPFQGFCPPEILEFCDDVMEVAQEFDEIYDKLKAAIEGFAQVFEFSLLQTLETHLGTLDIGSLEHLKERVKDEFTYRVKVLRFFLSVFNQSMVLLLLTIFWSADRYQQKYLNDLEFDNCYITWYFRKIDARREEQQKNHLLPLSFLEKMELIPPTKFRLLPSEKSYLKISLLLILPHLMTALVIFLVDYCIVYSAQLVARHAQLHIRTQGEHKLDVGIAGESFLAGQLRKYLDEIHSHRSLDVEVSTHECLPRPFQVDYVQAAIVAAIYFAILVETRIEAYCRRFRSILCAFCHYKQEKRRILWLYNTSLRKRLGWTTYRARTIQNLVEQNSLKRDVNLFLDLRDAYPKLFGWLRRCPCAKRRCIVCDTYEDKTFRVCFECGHAYCSHCWRFVGNRCVFCKPLTKQNPQEEVTSYDSAAEVLNDEAPLLGN